MKHDTFWNLLFVSSLFVVILGLYTFNNLAVNISGDGVPNRPQKEPPIKYPRDTAIQIIVIVVVSTIVTVYSMVKVFQKAHSQL